MTILDSIKYQLSDSPTIDELEALPIELFARIAYTIETAFAYSNPMTTAKSLSTLLWNQKKLVSNDYEYAMQLIRQIIYEYDDLR